jgi:hypothetical protein
MPTPSPIRIPAGIMNPYGGCCFPHSVNPFVISLLFVSVISAQLFVFIESFLMELIKEKAGNDVMN